jgi:hypothetical protein
MHPVERVVGKATAGSVAMYQLDVGQVALADCLLGVREHPRLVVEANDLAGRAHPSAENVEHP